MAQNTDTQIQTRHWRSAIPIALILCAAIMLLTRPYLLEAVRTDNVAPEWLFLGPCLFLALFLLSLIPDFVHPAPVGLLGYDYLRLLFALFVVLLSFPASIREYKARKTKEPMSMMVEALAHDKDARVRAVALIASASHIFSHPDFLALIRQGLLDKDPLVRQAASLIIEDKLGIELPRDTLSANKVQELIQGVHSQASLIKKGSP